MNAQSSPINATVILRDENDYRTWYNQLQARCEAYKWIKNLKLEAGIAPKFEQEQTRNRYQNALKPPRSVNVWDLWLTEYSQAATEAEMLNVPEVSQINIITADFTSAVNKIAPIWAATFQATGKDQPGLSRKDMMRRFREYMTLNHPVTRGRS
ncbi:hypothetical protein ACJQWK_00751 [Exserohilum turcicum]